MMDVNNLSLSHVRTMYNIFWCQSRYPAHKPLPGTKAQTRQYVPRNQTKHAIRLCQFNKTLFEFGKGLQQNLHAGINC